MKTHQQSSGHIGTTNAMIMELLGGLSEDQDLPAFNRTADAMTFHGTTATVSFDLKNASVQIYCKGQQNSVYDSQKPGQCQNMDFAEQLGMEAISEMIAASSAQSEKGRAIVLAKLAKRPW